MSSSRFFKIAHGLLLTNFIFALLAFISNTYSLIDHLVNGYNIPGFEEFSLWEIHLGNTVGVIQLIVVMAVYYFSRKALEAFMKEERMTDHVLLFIDKLIKGLSVLAMTKLITHFFFPSQYMGSFFNHFLNSSFMTRQADSLESYFLLTKVVIGISNIVSLFTFYLNPANCIFFIVVLKGFQKFYNDNKSLKTELESVI